MKQITTIILALIFSSVQFTTAAQNIKTDAADTAELPEFFNDITIGANLGFTLSNMRYSGQIYNIYDNSPIFSSLGGLFFDWRFHNNVSLRPHLNLVGRGTSMKYNPQFIDYKLKATYFDLRIPLIYTFNLSSKFLPYLAVGPSFNFVAGGKLYYSENEQPHVQSYNLKLANSNINGFDLGLYLGAGAGYPVQISGYPLNVGFEIGYNLGLIDTFAAGERDQQSIAINLPEYSIDGTRKNSNIYIAVNVSIPLKGLLGKKKKVKKQNIQAPVVYTAPVVQERKVTVQEKQCCSLEEMYELILSGQDISTKKVCAFNDIRFDFDKASIRPESENYLDKFITILTKFSSLHLSIIGHTDNIGDSHYNLQLSKRRAEAVAKYFIENGIDPVRLRCYGYGSRQPLTDNSTPDARAMNRRVEFDIIEGAF